MIITNTTEDSGPPGYNASKHTLTRVDTGFVNPRCIIDFPGQYDEHLLFEKYPCGRYNPGRWVELVEDIKKHGVINPVTIFKEKNGKIHITEGNHRVRAAIQAGLDMVPVEVRYFGNSQKQGLVCTIPNT